MRLFKGIALGILIVLGFLFATGCGDEKSPNSSTSFNQAPKITGYTMSPSSDAENYLSWGWSCELGVLARDPDGDSLIYTWTESGYGYFTTSNTEDTVWWQSPEFSSEGGIYPVTCTVSDGSLSDSIIIIVYVAPKM